MFRPSCASDTHCFWPGREREREHVHSVLPHFGSAFDSCIGFRVVSSVGARRCADECTSSVVLARRHLHTLRD